MLKRRGISENLRGIQVAPLAPLVNHLLFADDSLMFLAANVEGAHEIMDILERYSKASGQKVNLNKSSVHLS
jgi:hypothetical protein